MTPYEELQRDLENAKALANKDPSDLRHSNPGRVKRQFREQREAARHVTDLVRAIDIAEMLQTQDIPWTREGRAIYFQLRDGSKMPVLGETNQPDRLERQFEAMNKETGSEQREALLLANLNVEASRDFKWIRDRMAGTSAPKFRKQFLTRSGLIHDREDWLEMTSLASDYELLSEHEGEFGPWFTATGLGTAWIYSCYMAGNIPMTKTAKFGPQRQIELDAILAHHVHKLGALPQDLKDLAGV